MLKETDLLNHICQTTEMGTLGIDKIIDYAEDEKLKKALEQQKTEYSEMYRCAADMLCRFGEQPKNINPMAKLSSEISISAKALTDHSASKIAEMMILGNTRGVTKSLQCLDDYCGNDKQVTSLAKKLLKTEQANIEQMKPFL